MLDFSRLLEGKALLKICELKRYLLFGMFKGKICECLILNFLDDFLDFLGDFLILGDFWILKLR